ncbi:MAG: hypothetical protein XU15_C0011G0150 [candidate division NC10 bacterium CSP1-5]|nr:MAG: hypothetical protein XU15_C0011G0006 [candidate division NC10 bacterium CSP1-5]KRT69468.1 MAG: hypothetical protein XU15_C0011G0150 [candidate division NC10 bacterium CSP1-5]
MMPPDDASLSHVLKVLTSQYQVTGAQILDLARRLDDLRDRLGAYNEQNIERFNGHGDRIEEVEKALGKLSPMVETISKSLGELRPMIEAQLTNAVRVGERAERVAADGIARYQQSLTAVQDDFDERQASTRGEIMVLVDSQKLRLDRLEVEKQKGRSDETEITKTRILSRANVQVALLTLLGSSIVAGIVSVVIELIKRGNP